MTLRIALLALLLWGCDSAPLQHCRYGGHWDGKAWHCMAAPSASPSLLTMLDLDMMGPCITIDGQPYRVTGFASDTQLTVVTEEFAKQMAFSMLPTPTAQPSTFMDFAPLYHGGIPKTRPTPRDKHPW